MRRLRVTADFIHDLENQARGHHDAAVGAVDAAYVPAREFVEEAAPLRVVEGERAGQQQSASRHQPDAGPAESAARRGDIFDLIVRLARLPRGVWAVASAVAQGASIRNRLRPPAARPG